MYSFIVQLILDGIMRSMDPNFTLFASLCLIVMASLMISAHDLICLVKFIDLTLGLEQ